MENNLLPESIYETLPDLLKELTTPFVGRERDIVLLSSIGVISSILPKVFGIYDRSRFYSNLFTLIIAPPASGKGMMNKSKVLVEKIHNYIKEISLAEIEDCNAEKKGNKGIKCPELKIKILPGNVSSSKIYKHIQNSNYGLLIFETEADTISTMLKNDWGNFSDVLRKAFHHETISISREIDDKYFEVPNPKLSLVISGTPDQVKPLIQSKANGLFSRFLFYYFNEPVGWKDVSPNGSTVDYNQFFSEAGEDMFRLYGKLIDNNQCEVEIKLSDTQWQTFNDTMSYVVDVFIKEKKLDIIPIIKRQGVMMFRICMILTIIRHKENTIFESSITCNDEDFETALKIIKTTIDHSIQVSSLLGGGNNLSVKETLLLSSLPQTFQRREAITAGEQLNIPKRTVDYTLRNWTKSKIINKVSNGNYSKIKN